MRRALFGLLIFYFLLSVYFYHVDSIAPNQPGPPESALRKPKPLEKELIVASMKGDDVSWLAEYFTDWRSNIYIVNDHDAPLTVPKNKGREAMPFLT